MPELPGAAAHVAEDISMGSNRYGCCSVACVSVPTDMSMLISL